MDKWDETYAEIKRENRRLETIEDAYRKGKKKLEEEYNGLSDFRQRLQVKLEETQYAAIDDISRMAVDDSTYINQVDQIIQTYFTANEDIYRDRLRDLEEREDDLDSQFKKDFRQQEDKIEALYAELRKIDQEEQDKKRGK